MLSSLSSVINLFKNKISIKGNKESIDKPKTEIKKESPQDQKLTSRPEKPSIEEGIYSIINEADEINLLMLIKSHLVNK